MRKKEIKSSGNKFFRCEKNAFVTLSKKGSSYIHFVQKWRDFRLFGEKKIFR